MDGFSELRRTRGFSQRTLAKAAGVSPSTIYALESGTHTGPHPSTAKKLAEAMGVEVVDILAAIEAPKGQAPSPESASVAARSEDEQRGLAILYRELTQSFRGIEQNLKSREQLDFDELGKLDLAHAYLAKQRGKPDILGRELDELAKAKDELFLVKERISRLLEQELVERLDEEQRAQADAFKRRQARASKAEQTTERDTA